MARKRKLMLLYDQIWPERMFSGKRKLAWDKHFVLTAGKQFALYNSIWSFSVPLIKDWTAYSNSKSVFLEDIVAQSFRLLGLVQEVARYAFHFRLDGRRFHNPFEDIMSSTLHAPERQPSWKVIYLTNLHAIVAEIRRGSPKAYVWSWDVKLSSGRSEFNVGVSCEAFSTIGI